MKLATITAAKPKYLRLYNRRRPFDDDRPHLYGLESDRDYFDNNRDLILKLLKPYETFTDKRR